MGVFEDVLKALDRLPGWKRLSGLAAEHDALTKRVEVLELRLAASTGDRCPKCGVMAYSVHESRPEPGEWGRLGAMEDEYRCRNCSYTNVVKRGV